MDSLTLERATKVIHIKDAPAGWRSNPHYVDISRNSKWGNQYSHLPNSRAQFRVDTRAEACQKAKDSLLDNLELLGNLFELYGKVLVCYCKPEQCHGDFLAYAADMAAFAVEHFGLDHFLKDPAAALRDGWRILQGQADTQVIKEQIEEGGKHLLKLTVTYQDGARRSLVGKTIRGQYEQGFRGSDVTPPDDGTMHFWVPDSQHQTLYVYGDFQFTVESVEKKEA